VDRCKSCIVKFFSRCGAARSALKNERERVGMTSYKLITPTETRWHSRLTMGGRVHLLAGEMVVAVETMTETSAPADIDKALKMRSKLVKEQELLEFREICDLLRTAGDFTHLVGGSSYPTIQPSLPSTPRCTGLRSLPPYSHCGDFEWLSFWEPFGYFTRLPASVWKSTFLSTIRAGRH
jgi:hypothetical protein